MNRGGTRQPGNQFCQRNLSHAAINVTSNETIDDLREENRIISLAASTSGVPGKRCCVIKYRRNKRAGLITDESRLRFGKVIENRDIFSRKVLASFYLCKITNVSLTLERKINYLTT